MLDSGVIQTQLLNLRHIKLNGPEKFLLKELTKEGLVLQALLPAGSKDTLFGPIATKCLSWNLTQLAHLCSPQELALVATAIKCLVYKSSTSWRTCTKDETHLLIQGCPELRFVDGRVQKGERLLLCSPKKKTPFLH